MKKMFLLSITLTFVFCAASLGFAANEFQVKGIITKISGNQITIKDDAGKETTLEGRLSDINVGDPVLLKWQIFKTQKENIRTELTPQDIEFLTKQCLVDQVDVNIIPMLKARPKLISWIDKRNCKPFEGFKASRTYYRKLNIKSVIPLPPLGWDIGYLTDDEFKNYLYILDNAPW